MQYLRIKFGRVVLRDFTEADRPAFLSYQTDPGYLQLYDFDDELERPNRLFDVFMEWQQDQPRKNLQLAICESTTGCLLGCGGLRKVDDDVAVLGIELAPSEWGGYRLALDATAALLRYGFETLDLTTITGDTASGDRRVEKLAQWFGAEIVARRSGPEWMQARGWQEVDWVISRETWRQAHPPRVEGR